MKLRRKQMPGKEAGEIEAIIHSARTDRDGTWKLTLEIPSTDGPKVAALALQTETVFKVKFITT